MNRTAPIVLVVGLVLSLGGLAFWQWQKNQQLTTNLTGAEAVYLNQKKTQAEQEATIGNLKQELLRCQNQLAGAQEERKVAQERLASAEQKISAIAADRQQLQLALTNWVALAGEKEKRWRDTQAQLDVAEQRLTVMVRGLTSAEEQVESVTAQLRSARQQVSEVTSNYAALVARYNLLKTRVNPASGPVWAPVE